jgi:hypothetical protein
MERPQDGQRFGMLLERGLHFPPKLHRTGDQLMKVIYFHAYSRV